MSRRSINFHRFMNFFSTLLLLVSIGRLAFILWVPRPERNWRHERGTAVKTDMRRDAISRNKDSERTLYQDHISRLRNELMRHPKVNTGRDSSLRGYEHPAIDNLQSVGIASGINRGWGVGGRVLIFTMDSLKKTIASAARGGPAGEIKIRESLTAALQEAGVQVMEQNTCSASLPDYWLLVRRRPIRLSTNPRITDVA